VLTRGIPLGDFVLQHQVAAENVRGELRDDTMVLMGIVRAMSEDDVWANACFQVLQPLFEPFRLAREETVLEVGDVDGLFLSPAEKCLG
jgi:hypothetical protein